MPVLLKNDAPFSEGSMNDMIKMWDPKRQFACFNFWDNFTGFSQIVFMAWDGMKCLLPFSTILVSLSTQPFT